MGNPFPMNFARGSNFICPPAPPTAGTSPNAAPPLHGDNSGGTSIKLVEDAAPGCTTHRGDSLPLSSPFPWPFLFFSSFVSSHPRKLHWSIFADVEGPSRFRAMEATKSTVSAYWLVEGTTGVRGGIVGCGLTHPSSFQTFALLPSESSSTFLSSSANDNLSNYASR